MTTFSHHPRIRQEFPTLTAGVLLVDHVSELPRADQAINELQAIASARLATHTESDLVEIQAWRRAFAQMGLKPTQYRCASEALLRRFRKQGDLPRLHPLVDLCNAASIAYAIPVAVLDRDTITDNLLVRHARGDEDYLSFGADHENPAPEEVIFADGAGQAHARRWTNRQSARSAARPDTQAALIVVEALHHNGQTDASHLLDTISLAITGAGHARPTKQILTDEHPTINW